MANSRTFQNNATSGGIGSSIFQERWSANRTELVYRKGHERHIICHRA
jgi:hypothetical protein